MTALSVQEHPAEILTPRFQISGQLEAVGSLSTFINDAGRGSLTLVNATLSPIAAQGSIKTFACPRLVLRKSEVVLLYFTAEESRASIRPLVRRELLVAYTAVMVCRGYFHLPAEASIHEFIDLLPGQLLPVTDVRLFPLVCLPRPLPSEADLVLLGRNHLQFYHPV